MTKMVFDFHGSHTHSSTALLRVVDALGELSLYPPNGKDPESGLSGLHWDKDEETGMVPVEFPSELGKALIEGKRIYFRDADHRPVSLKKHSKEGKPSYWSLRGSVFEIRYPID